MVKDGNNTNIIDSCFPAIVDSGFSGGKKYRAWRKVFCLELIIVVWLDRLFPRDFLQLT